MKIATAYSDVEHVGPVNSLGSFQIDLTAKTVSVLSSTLYRDKNKAVLREIAANAFDAHTDKGIPERPIDIHLPTPLEPYLSIRDYGYGISPDNMVLVYRRYFASTKTHSNAFVGALGLGSKSPLCKVNAFAVVSIWLGVKRTYDVFLNRNGIPDLAQRGHTEIVAPIDVRDLAWLQAFEPVINNGGREEDGLEVIVPISNVNDYADYVTKAREVFLYYPVKPNFTGASVSFPQYETVMSGDGWELTNGYHGARAVMGVVAYPIGTECLDSDSDLDSEEKALLTNLIEAPFVLRFDIGDLDFTPGREDLSYDPRTAKFVLDALKGIADKFSTIVQQEFDQCDTLLEAKRLYASYFRDGKSTVGHILGKTYPVNWGGHVITNPGFAIDLENDYPNSTITVYQDSKRGKHRHSVIYRATSEESTYLLLPNANHRMLIRDIPNGFNPRVWAWRAENPKSTALLIHSTDKDELDRLVEYLDGYEFEMVSELPKPTGSAKSMKTMGPTEGRVMTTYAKTTTFRLGKLNESTWWRQTIFDPAEGGFYMAAKRNDLVVGVASLRTVMEAAENAGLLDRSTTDVIAVSGMVAKKLTKSDIWVNYFDHVQNSVNDFLTDERKEDIKTRMRLRRFMEQNIYISTPYISIPAVGKLLASNHRIAMLADDLIDTGMDGKVLDNIAILAKSFGIDMPDIRDEDDLLSAQWNDIVGKYPLLPYMFRKDHRPVASDVAKYVTDIDSTAASV